MVKPFFAVLLFILVFVSPVYAQEIPERSLTPTFSLEEVEEATSGATIDSPTPTPRPDLTQKTEETIGPLERLLDSQDLGPMLPLNPIKYAIRSAVVSGVPANTIVLLLLLPGIAALIAAARHLVGLRGFGIFLPAALSISFVAIGPLVGITLFIVIVTVSTVIRMILRRFKIKLQYLPKMALMTHFIVLSILFVLFAAPLINWQGFASVSIFPVLFIVLLAEEFNRVLSGKSASVAVNLATETLILALVAYLLLVYQPVQSFVLLHPETYILGIAIFDFFVGKYVGLRLIEFWRFRKLISG